MFHLFLGTSSFKLKKQENYEKYKKQIYNSTFGFSCNACSNLL
ncbi:hypothetical protein KL86DYS2_10039 [uncultured Dysgonomonas sp.]|uniref:Uncharacterized protein n=1 Tax=uncultured Dysgonomonas sp. TaxID=206096 RepID=A0A212ITY8_9BACT|nr:hypothetical protein KL86DYS2_10039 [uncultured Dysgonomonas sp.]